MYQKFQLDLNKIEDQRLYQEKVKKYVHSESFRCDYPFKSKQFCYVGDEARYFVSGNVIFKVDNDEIECSSGTLLVIDKCVNHSFEYIGGEKLRVDRFYTNYDESEKNFQEDNI